MVLESAELICTDHLSREVRLRGNLLSSTCESILMNLYHGLCDGNGRMGSMWSSGG